MLHVNEIGVAYGGLHALSGVTLSVGAGQFVAIVGPNGAGKTSLFKAISGTVPLAAGSISFDGVDLASVLPSDRPALGIAHVPEGRQVFKSLTVLENLEMGAQTRAARQAFRRSLDLIYGLFPRLAERRSQAAGTLSGGEQQMVAIGRGLASCPRLLMLDEPSMGLAPAIADQIFETVERIHVDSGLSVLLVEQRVAEALEACDHGYVLESGRVALQGGHTELMQDARVKRAYLGM
jgi:branched-chain amino acid transport system ATP-binding protein